MLINFILADSVIHLNVLGNTVASAAWPTCSSSPRRSELVNAYCKMRKSANPRAAIIAHFRPPCVRVSKNGNSYISERMHTALTRANALVAYTMSVLASLTFLCFVSTFFNEYQVPLSESSKSQHHFTFLFLVFLWSNIKVVNGSGGGILLSFLRYRSHSFSNTPH